MSLQFTKMQGTGNDFVVIDDREGDCVGREAELARAVSPRRTSVGADGVIFVRKPELAGCDLKMVYHNADGSYAGMCGNGIRCVAWYSFRRIAPGTAKLSIQVGENAHQVQVEASADGRTGLVSVDMGVPRLTLAEVPAELQDVPADARWVGKELRLLPDFAPVCTLLSMGNPHCVMWMGELTDELVLGRGRQIESLPLFPERVNADFVRLADKHRIELRVWERGVGETMACGSGACAAVVAGILVGKLPAGEGITVQLPGGELVASWGGEGKPAMMRGPVTLVFDGEFELGP